MENHQKVVVTGFLVKNGKVLVAKRSMEEKFLPGYYELPGGKLNFAESPEDGLKREWREEMGIEIEVLNPFHVFDWTTPELYRHSIEIDFLVRPVHSDFVITLDHSHTEFAWITQQDMSKYLFSPEAQGTLRRGFIAAELMKIHG